MRANQFIPNDNDTMHESVAGPEKCWPGHRKVGTQPGTGKNAGKRVNDCEKIGEENKGLYYNVNKRKAAGTSRPASSPKAPTAQAWKDAAKTAKNQGVAEGVDPATYPARAKEAHEKYLKYENLVDQELRKFGQRLPKSWCAGTLVAKLSSDPKYALALKYYNLSEKFAGLAIWYEDLAKKRQGVAEAEKQSKSREMDLDWHYKNIVNTKGLSDKAKKDTTDIYNKLKKNKEQGVAEGAPELLKKEMPLHRHAEKLLAQNGVSKDDPDYHHHLGNTIKHLRQFGNIDLINKQGVAEAGYSGIDDTDTVGFSVNSEQAYNAVMARFGDQIDHDETSGILYVPARMWPKVEMVAFDADGEGATQADGLDEGEKIGNMDSDDFDAAMARLKKLAGAGPMRTVYDPNRRVYRNMPTAQQPAKQPKK